MTPKEYIQEALRTESGPNKIVLSQKQIRLLHAFMGMSTESAEMLDNFKKFIFYGREYDEINAIEEVGDILWYIAIFCSATNITMEELMEKNIAKLRARYPRKFTAAKALIRDLKKERMVLGGMVLGEHGRKIRRAAIRRHNLKAKAKRIKL